MAGPFVARGAGSAQRIDPLADGRVRLATYRALIARIGQSAVSTVPWPYQNGSEGLRRLSGQ